MEEARETVLYKIKNMDKLIVRTLIPTIKPFNQVNASAVPSRTQMQIMDYILDHKDEEIHQHDLEAVLNLRRATISGILGTMEKNGIIERITDEKDTRTKKIILNPKAKEMYKKGSKQVKEMEKAILEGISEDELDIFNIVLEKMRGNLIKMGGVS